MKWNNRKIVIDIFWQHVRSLGPLERYLEWAAKPGAISYQFELYEELARRSVDAMPDRFEREAVELLNRKRFGGRLTPGPEMILGPQFKVPSDHTLRQWYLVWNKRYGSSRATDIRRGKDLACYNGAPIVLKEEATWNSVDSFDEEHIAWLSVCGSEVWQVQMQPFPTKHLYVLTLNSNPVWEFDDWPVNWKR